MQYKMERRKPHLKYFPQSKEDRKIFIDAVIVVAVKGETKRLSCKAQWDTGADATHVTEKAIKDFGLTSMGEGNTKGIEGNIVPVDLYKMDISIMDEFFVQGLQVKQMPQSNNKTYDLLIGIDLINQFDFCFVNVQDKNTLVLRYPPTGDLDFKNST
jgi:hypothetical protein